jgi:hypothetical protein
MLARMRSIALLNTEVRMGPSEKSFNQVKSILGKLDRNIDQLRAQRLNPTPTNTPFAPPTPAPAPAATPPRAASGYGRATPLPPR